MIRTRALTARAEGATLRCAGARSSVPRFVLRIVVCLWFAYVLVAPAPAGAQVNDQEPTSATSDDSSAQVNPEFDWEAEYAARLSPKDERLRTLFGDPAYDFCNDPEYVLAVDERPLCAFAEEASARCPELRSACARPVHLDRIDFS